MAFCDTLRAHDPGGAHNSVHISVHLQVDRNTDRVYFLAGFFFGGVFSRGPFFFGTAFFFQKSKVDCFSGLIAQNSEEYDNKGGCKNKKVSAGVPSLGEMRPQHMCLASYLARVSAAERRKDENCTLDPLFSGPPGAAFSGGLYCPAVHPNVHRNVHRNVHLGWTLRWTLWWTVGWTAEGRTLGMVPPDRPPREGCAHLCSLAILMPSLNF